MMKRTQPGEILENPMPFRGHNKCQNQVGTEQGELDKQKADLCSWSKLSKGREVGGEADTGPR